MSCEYLYCTMVYRGTIKDAGKKAQLVYKDDILRWSKNLNSLVLSNYAVAFQRFEQEFCLVCDLLDGLELKGDSRPHQNSRG